MNGFCGAIVTLLRSSGCAVTAEPPNAGREGGGPEDAIGLAPAEPALRARKAMARASDLRIDVNLQDYLHCVNLTSCQERRLTHDGHHQDHPDSTNAAAAPAPTERAAPAARRGRNG